MHAIQSILHNALFRIIDKGVILALKLRNICKFIQHKTIYYFVLLGELLSRFHDIS